MARHQWTQVAYDRLKAEFDDLTTRGRIQVAEKIERAREMGDLSENGDYHAAKDEQGHMEARIRTAPSPSSTTATVTTWPSAISSATSKSAARVSKS